MNTSVETPRCPQCGSPLPANAPQGLCPRCLIAGVAAATESGTSIGHGDKTDAPSLPEIADAFPQLEILDLVGQGGMGAVYKARQPRLDRFVALKVLPKRLAREPNFRERFSREGRMLARLNHPNVVSVFDFGESGGFFYLLMEYVEGVNLRQAMRAGRFTLAQALRVVPEICGALSYAHGEGVLHRDIKPENILLDVRGRVKIADFGIAKLVGETDGSLTATDATLGTPHYMAPEQVERPADVDHRADIYSLGVVFYEMLTGELPLGHFAPPSERSPLDPRVDDVVMRALARERERRQQTAAQVKSEVETIAATAPLGARPGLVSAAAPAVSNAHANWSVKAIVAAVAAIPAWFIAFAGAGLLLSYQGVGNRSNWIGFLPAVALSLVPVALVTWLGASTLRDPQLRTGAKRGAWLAALSRQALPVVLIQVAFSLTLGQIAPSVAPILVFVTIPAGFGIGLWLAERAHRRVTGRSASPWPLRFASIGAALYICLVLPVAAYFASGERRQPSQGRNDSPMRSSLPLPEHAITLVAIAPHPSTGETWWRADGTQATEGPFLNHSSRAVPGPGERAYEFVFRTEGLPPDASSPAWRFKRGANWATGQPSLGGTEILPGYHLLSASLPATARTVEMRAGIALGQWETLLSCEPRGGITSSRSMDGENWVISISEAVQASDGELVLNVAHPRTTEWETRVIAATKGGEEIDPVSGASFGNQTTARFRPREPGALKEFRFQARRYHWTEFRDVALQPSAKKRGE